jgi:RHS repeat-associated protein
VYNDLNFNGNTSLGDYRYGFQGQETDDEIKGEGNSVNYKYRMHDPRIGRFFAVDPLTAKYPYNSPYAFVSNSPILYIERKGRDYTPYVNHDTKTITIKAVYYTECGDTDSYNSAVEATKFWNEQGNKFQYKVGKGKDADYYDIVFDFKVKEVDIPKKQLSVDRETDPYWKDFNKKKYGMEALVEDGSSNVYEVKKEKDFQQNKTNTSERNGVTQGGNRVTVRESAKSGRTGGHEIGHTLGFKHIDFTIMSEAINRNNTSNIDVTIMQRILYNSGLGKRDVQYKYRAPAAAQYKTEKGEEPEEFKKGKVKIKK